MAKTERLRRSSISLTQTQFHNHLQVSLLTVKNIHILIICIAAMCTYPVQPVCTSLSSLLFILLFIKSHYTVFAHLICFALFFYSIAHFTLYFSFLHIYIYIYIYIYTQWGKKVFSQPPIVQVLPLKMMREACNFHHRYTSTMRDKIRNNTKIKIQKITL